MFEVPPNEDEQGAPVPSEATPADAVNQAATEPPVEITADALIAQLQSDLDAERARYAELYDRFQRASAEFQNTRRRQEKQMADAIELASSHVIRRLLPVIDDFDLAFQNVPEDASAEDVAWVGGFRQIRRKLMTVLDEEGVTPMPTDGEFDPVRHEAIGAEASDSVESGHILSTLRVGYEQSGRVIRPALVRVAQ